MSPARERFEIAVLPRLRSLGRRLRLYLLLEGTAAVLVTALALALVSYLLDCGLWLEQSMRVLQLVAGVSVIAAVVWQRLVQPLQLRIGPAQLALLLEARYPQLGGRLVSAVDFARAGQVGARRRSSAMVAEVLKQASAAAASLPFAETLQHARARSRAGVIVACAALAVAAAWLAGPSASLWAQRNLLLRNVDWPRRNSLSIEGLSGGRLLVPRGDDAAVSAVVDAGFEAPRQVYIEYQSASGLHGRDQMPAVVSEAGGPARFTYTFERVGETLQCRVSGGDARTEPFNIEVVERPRIIEVAIGITPPRYTRAEAYELRPGQTVAEALKGSRIRLRIRTNEPVTRAVLVRQSGGQERDIAPAERLPDGPYAVEDRPEASSSYYFRMVDARGLSNISERTPPLRASVRLIADLPPKVKLRLRGVGEMITPQAVLPVEADFADTYGLASARLVAELARTPPKRTAEPLPSFEPGTKTFARTVDWSAAAHGVVEGDRLNVHAEGTDFDDVSGPNTGSSATVALRVVSRDELLVELSRREQEYRQDFERLIDQQEKLYWELLGRGPGGEQPSLARYAQLARLQRDYAARCQSLRTQFEQILSELRVNGLSTPAMEARLGQGIVEPMGALSRSRMPAAADGLEDLARVVTADALNSAKIQQQTVLADMRRILNAMVKWEGFQEAVTLLREVQRMQGSVKQETDKRLEAEVFGTQPASGPSK